MKVSKRATSRQLAEGRSASGHASRARVGQNGTDSDSDRESGIKTTCSVPEWPRAARRRGHVMHHRYLDGARRWGTCRLFRAQPKSIPTNLQIKLCLRDLDVVDLIKMYGHDPSQDSTGWLVCKSMANEGHFWGARALHEPS